MQNTTNHQMNCPLCNAPAAPGAAICPSCGASIAAELASVSTALPPGARLHGGAYAVGKVLGQGGFGITYKGAQVTTRRCVAIKEFFPPGAVRHGLALLPSAHEAQSFAQARLGFSREAQSLARFDHPGVVRVFDSFEENNTAYMVMEFLEGESLQQRLARAGVLPEKEAVRLVSQVGEALQVVHGAGLIHRDIKPGNIMIVAQGDGGERAVLVDFGTARGFHANKTMRHTAMLTGGYAPLEQYTQTARFGPYTDVYALGATLYEALTGEMPVGATDRFAGVEMRSPSEVNSFVSRAASDAVMWALQMRAPDRPQNVADFLHALRHAPPAATSTPSAPQLPPQFPPQFSSQFSSAPSPAVLPAGASGASAPTGWNAPPAEDVGFYARPDFKVEAFLRSLVGIKALALQAPRAYHATQKWAYCGAKAGSFLGLAAGLRTAAGLISLFNLSLAQGSGPVLAFVVFVLSLIVCGFAGYRLGYALGHCFDRT